MAHARQQIRDQLVTILTGATDAGTNVDTGRVFAVATLPHVAVETGAEEVAEGLETLGTKQFREVVINTEIRASVATGLQDVLDDIAAQIESTIYADQTLGGLVKIIEYEGSERGLEEGDQRVGLLSLTWTVLYRIDATDPETIID